MSNKTINCNGKLVSLATPLVMGILNSTPDSFYEESRVSVVASALERVAKMLEEGAAIIDIGAQSSRPGAHRLTDLEEWQRLSALLPALVAAFPKAIFSIDTFYGLVAQKAIDEGIALVNDISAGTIDPSILQVVAKAQVPYIAMHMQGIPQTMQQAPHYENILSEIILHLSEKIAQLRNLGINDVIVDPGFGFGKTLEHNYHLLKNLEQLQVLNVPILAGLSRKSMIYKLLNIDAAHALNGTTALHMVALQQGAKLLRVHDVKAAVEVIALYTKLKTS